MIAFVIAALVSASLAYLTYRWLTGGRSNWLSELDAYLPSFFLFRVIGGIVSCALAVSLWVIAVLLNRGKKIYAVSSDDSHSFK